MISPASTRLYRNTTKSRSQVGQELGVDYVLDGHVRWDKATDGPRRVRVTVELVRSRDGTSVWADRYDATSEDLFAVEGTIGEKVAAALEVALEEPDRKNISARPTTNFEAYTYFLRAEALRTAPEDNAGASLAAVPMYERAVALDPKFALAFARMAQTYSEIYWSNGDRTAHRLALMRNAAETAVQLDPDLPEARLALALYYYRGQRDYERATREIDIALQRQPGRGELLLTRGLLLRRQGRLVEAAASLKRAAELDPRAHDIAWSLAWTYGVMRDYPDAVRYLERTLALAPRWSALYADLGLAHVMWHGDVTKGRRIVAQGMALPDAGRIVDRLRFQAQILIGYTARDSAVLQRLTPEMFHGDTSQYLLWNADWARRHGETTRGRAFADSALKMLARRVKADPGEPGPRMLLALTYAQLGRKIDALREGHQAVEMLPISRDAIDGGEMQEDMAYAETLVGEADAAIDRLAYLLTIPSDVSVALLRIDPMWDRLRGNPRFQRLLATPTK
jgi:serine/threonine-protein kinase